MATELGKADELMAEAVQHLFQAGGKRFRPLFTVLSAQLGPEPDAWQVTVAGAVIELVHLATLYHDDVMDEAQVRRGARQRQRPLGQQHRDPGRRLPVRDGVAAGVPARARRGAHHRRHLRPAGHRADARDARRGRGRRLRRALPQGGLREDGLPDRGVRHGSVRRSPAPTRSRSSGSAGSAASSARRSRSPTTSSTSTATPTSRARCRAPTCAKACTPCPCCTRCGRPGPTPTGCASCWRAGRGRRRRWPRRWRCCARRAAWSQAKETVAQYAAQARDELAKLPDVPGRQALANLVDYTVNRHG